MADLREAFRKAAQNTTDPDLRQIIRRSEKSLREEAEQRRITRPKGTSILREKFFELGMTWSGYKITGNRQDLEAAQEAFSNILPRFQEASAKDQLFLLDEFITGARLNSQSQEAQQPKRPGQRWLTDQTRQLIESAADIASYGENKKRQLYNYIYNRGRVQNLGIDIATVRIYLREWLTTQPN